MFEIAPSILSADFTRLADEIVAVEAGGAKVLHVDVMDGHFVPNITIGLPVVKSLRKATSMIIDTHLMIEEPGRYAVQSTSKLTYICSERWLRYGKRVGKPGSRSIRRHLSRL
jgi:ribulose-phosphate 3-epimerase